MYHRLWASRLSLMPDPEARTVLGPGNLVGVGTLVVLVSAIIGGTLWAAKVDNRLGNLEAGLAGVIDRYDGYVSQSTFDLWLDLMQARNPAMDVPKIQMRFR